MKKIISLFLICLIFLCGSSCQTIETILQEPRVSLASVDFGGINFQGVDLICRLNMENPNAFEIPFPEIDWELYINSASFVKGKLDNGTQLRSHGTTTVDVPLNLSYATLFDAFSSLWNTREAAYKLAFGIKFPVPLLENKTYQLDHSGNIPLLQIPKIHPGSFRISKVDFTGVEIEYGFAVENPNSFAIPFPNVDWEYAVNGHPLVTSSLNENGNISAQSQSPGNIKLNILYTDILGVPGSLGNISEVPSLLKMNSSFPVSSLQNAANILEIPGNIPILHMPELAFRGISIKSLGFQRFEFVANWDIENKNSFPMDISEFVYDLTVNNSSWAQGTIVNAPQLKANTRTTIPLDIAITSVPVITQIIDIINRGGGVNFNSVGKLNLTSDFPGLDALVLPFDFSGTTRLSQN